MLSPGQCVAPRGPPAPPNSVNYVARCTGCLCGNASTTACARTHHFQCTTHCLLGICIASLLNEYRPTRTLRSSDGLLFTIPFCRLSLGNRAFSINAPRVWNNLTHDSRACPSIACFKRNPKSVLFNVNYPV